MVFILLGYGAALLEGVGRSDTAWLTYPQGYVFHWAFRS